MNTPMHTIVHVTLDNQALWLGAVRALFMEYQTQLGIDLCFQGFADELATLPGDYACAAQGGLYLAVAADGLATGCVAYRSCPSVLDAAEMKRLYVRNAARGTGLGRSLAWRVLNDARARGYARMVLDTLSFLNASHALYESLGFTEIERYNDNLIPGTRFLSRTL